MENLISDLTIQSLLGLFILIIPQCESEWGKFQLIPILYEPPKTELLMTLKNQFPNGKEILRKPLKAQLAIFFGGKFDTDIVHNDERDVLKAWIEVANAKIPRTFSNESFTNPLRFNKTTDALQLPFWFKYTVYIGNTTENNMNFNKSDTNTTENAVAWELLFNESVRYTGNDIVWKPLKHTFVTKTGARFSFLLTTICASKWRGLSCDIRCPAHDPNTTICDAMANLICKKGYEKKTLSEKPLSEKPLSENLTFGNISESNMSRTWIYPVPGSVLCVYIDECLQNKCRLGSTCIHTPGSFKCICPDLVHGEFCQFRTDICKPNPCFNGGTCFQYNRTYTCQCVKPYYHGDNCERSLLGAEYGNDVLGIVYGLIGLCIAALTGFAGFIFYRKYSKKS